MNAAWMPVPAGGPRLPQQIGGASLIAAAILFSAVFAWLATHFSYPAVLQQPAEAVLPRLIGGGSEARSVWFLYAFLPFALIPAALGAQAALPHRPLLMRAALVMATLAALCMFLGLVRWPTIHWSLAQSALSDPLQMRAVTHVMFPAVNLYLGTLIGEFAGELALGGFFLATSVALLDLPGAARWVGRVGAVFSLAMLTGAFRNAFPAVQPVTDVTNYALPLFMIVLGVQIMRQRPPLM
jgi:Domain of unknown function (DUF4386)